MNSMEWLFHKEYVMNVPWIVYYYDVMNVITLPCHELSMYFDVFVKSKMCLECQINGFPIFWLWKYLKKVILFQKRVMRTKLDIYVSITDIITVRVLNLNLTRSWTKILWVVEINCLYYKIDNESISKMTQIS